MRLQTQSAALSPGQRPSGRYEPTLGGVRVHTDVGAVDLSLAAARGLAVGDRIRLRVDPALVRFVGVG